MKHNQRTNWLLHLRITKPERSATKGVYIVMDKNNEPVTTACVLELPWKDNIRDISCIPADTYVLEKRNVSWSKFKYEHLWIKDVPNRGSILAHIANYLHQIQGCQAVGSYFSGDAISKSKKAFDHIMKFLPEKTVIKIVDVNRSGIFVLGK